MNRRILYYIVFMFIGGAAGIITVKFLHDEFFMDKGVCIGIFILIELLFLSAAYFASGTVKEPEYKEDKPPQIEEPVESLPQQNSNVWGWLIPDEGPLKSGYPLNKEKIGIGRCVDCKIMINEDSISRHHAEIVKTLSGCLIRDTGSKNGVFVNNCRVTEQVLHDGDAIAISGKNFKIKLNSDFISEEEEFPVSELPEMDPDATLMGYTKNEEESEPDEDNN